MVNNPNKAVSSSPERLVWSYLETSMGARKGITGGELFGIIPPSKSGFLFLRLFMNKTKSVESRNSLFGVCTILVCALLGVVFIGIKDCQASALPLRTSSPKPAVSTKIGAVLFVRHGTSSDPMVGPFKATPFWKLAWSFNCPNFTQFITSSEYFKISVNRPNGTSTLIAIDIANSKNNDVVYSAGQGPSSFTISMPTTTCSWDVAVKSAAKPREGTFEANDIWENTATPDDQPAANICWGTNWSKTVCRRLANRQYWVGMTAEMLQASLGTPDVDNVSDYGGGEEHQLCYNDHKPRCFYERPNGIIHAYN